MCVPRLLDCADGPIRGLRAEHTFYNAAYHPRGRLKVQRGPRVPPRPPRVLQIVIPKRFGRDARRYPTAVVVLFPPPSVRHRPSSVVHHVYRHTYTCTSTTNRYDAVRSRRGSRWISNSFAIARHPFFSSFSSFGTRIQLHIYI